MSTHSSILAWEIPWTEESMEPQRVGPAWAHTHTDMPQPFPWQSIPLSTSQLSWYCRANTDLLKTYFSGTYYLSDFIVGSWDPTCGILGCRMQTISCSLWDPVPWPWIEPRPPALGVQSLSHCTTKEVPGHLNNIQSSNPWIWMSFYLFVFSLIF